MAHDDDGTKASLSHFPDNENGATTKWTMRWKSSTNIRKKPVLLISLVTALVFIGAIITFTIFMIPVPIDNTLNDNLRVPEEYVAEVLAHVFGQQDSFSTPSSNSTHLAKRLLPLEILCHTDEEWLGRKCAPSRNRRAFKDGCKRYPRIGRPVYYESFGSCDLDEFCQDGTDPANNMPSASCLPANPAGKDRVKKDPESKLVNQEGFRLIRPPKSPTYETTRIESIQVKENMGAGRTAAILADSKQSYAIAPNEQLVAHLRGWENVLCESGPKDRGCTPTWKHDFKAGDFVDFTFGLSFGQEAVLLYTMSGFNG